MSRQNLSRSDQVYVGKVTYGKYQTGKPGVETTPLYLYKVAPTLAVANNIALSQAINTGTPGLVNGALATAGVATLDVPRNIQAAWTGAAVLTVFGTDVYGEAMSEASASGTTFTGKKAFKTVTSITVSSNVTAATVGTGSIIGLPFRVDANDVLLARFNNAIDAGTFVPADTTSPATTTTGDIRGTFAAAGTFDGVKFLDLLIKVSDNTTKVGSFGQTQA